MFDKSSEGNKVIVSVPHEIIADDRDTLAYETGHFIQHTTDGNICSAGV